MLVSPSHETSDTWQGATIQIPSDGNQWNVDLKIDIFFHQIDGWYLEVADRVLNGWQSPEGEAYIRGIYPAQTRNAGKPAHCIPDSAFAAMQLMVPYFETIQFYKTADETESAVDRFTAGMGDVFGDFNAQGPLLGEVLYHRVRSSLYPIIPLRPRHQPPEALPQLRVSRPPFDLYTFQYSPLDHTWLINPYPMIRQLRTHLKCYADTLKDASQSELRGRFEAAFDRRTFGNQ